MLFDDFESESPVPALAPVTEVVFDLETCENVVIPVRESGAIPAPCAPAKRALVAGIHSDIPDRDYYADPCDVPSLSQSIAHTLVSKSPAHAWQEHPRLGGKPREATEAMSLGSLVHRLALGRGSDFEVIDAADWRTKAAREARDVARGAGKIPVLTHQLPEARGAAGIVTARVRELGFDLSDGDSESVVIWSEQSAAGGDVQCRGRLDFLSSDRALILDLKTTSDASPDALGRHMCEYGYDIQAAAYTSAIAHLHPELAGRIHFVFAFCELTAPYAVTAAECDGEMRVLGEAKWQHAVNVWERCLRENVWPGYATEIVRVAPPPWEMRRFMEASS